MKKITSCFIMWFFVLTAQASEPVWTFTPLTQTTITVTPNTETAVQYLVTNQSKKLHTLSMTPIVGIHQITTTGTCPDPFTLAFKESCTLSLQVVANELQGNVVGGPVVCQGGNALQCYQPGKNDILNITKGTTPPINIISVIGSPLSLGANGPSGTLTIVNDSLDVIATNINSDFTGTALQGKVTQTGSTCSVLLPGEICQLTFSAGPDTVPLTSFPIKGDNTNTVTAAIRVRTLFAYISNGVSSGPDSSVTQCNVLTNGNLTNCTTSQNFQNPQGIEINNIHNLMYFVNQDTNYLNMCSVDATDGHLFNCISQGNNMDRASGIVITGDATYLYIASTSLSSFGGHITKCRLDIFGGIDFCQNFGFNTFDLPTGVIINTNATRSYVSNNGDNTVFKCDAAFVNCADAGGSGFNQPVGMYINKAGTFLYVVNQGISDVSKCEVDGNGDLINCVLSGVSGLNSPRFIRFSANESLAYIVNAAGNNVTKCDVISGNLTNCSNTGTNMNAPNDIAFY